MLCQTAWCRGARQKYVSAETRAGTVSAWPVLFISGSSKYLVETPATGPSADTRKLTALPSRFATETLRLRFGLKVGAIGFQFRFGWTTH